ncbi:MAG: 6-phosphogluconate dehydrogenase, partial [Bacteroidetes bacterium HGW-Bacteroidetes-9]
MKIGFVGLGKMGFNMVHRLLNNNHEVVVWDRSAESIKEIVKLGAEGATSLEDLVAKLPARKVVWLMVPSGKPVDENLDLLLGLLGKDDIIIDGGNSYWRDTQQRAEKAAQNGINFIDCGTSGGVWGLQNGYSLMYGGNKDAADYLEPIIKSLAPEN